MTADLSNEDRGKTVVRGTERIGVVTDVASGTAYVDVDRDHVDDDLAATLDWDREDDQHTIEEQAITAVQNSEVRLREDLVG